jgi:hypothetical protein
MVSVVIGALMNVVSGFFPPIPQLNSMLTPFGANAVLGPSYSRWLQEGLFALEALELPPIFSFKIAGVASYFGYCQVNDEFDCTNTFARSMSIILGMGAIYRIATLAAAARPPPRLAEPQVAERASRVVLPEEQRRQGRDPDSSRRWRSTITAHGAQAQQWRAPARRVVCGQ